MHITFPQYIKNPMQNRVLSNRQMYDKMYKEKLNQLLLRENGQVRYFLFKDNESRYIVYIKVPSEKCKGFYYDVCIEFLAKDSRVIGSESIRDYFVRFYSNDPSFVFTYAYSFIQNDLFFEDLETKMSKQARTQKATITNKKNEVGYVKSIYFAYLIMELKGLFSKKKFDYEARKYSKTMLLQMVEHSSVKFANRQQVEKDQAADKKKFESLDKADASGTQGLRAAKAGNPKHVMSSRSVKKSSFVSKVKKI